MNAILYARYSTAMQSQASVEDQFRLLRDRAEREGWAIFDEQGDHAISGTVRDRPGLQVAMAAIEQGRANVLLAESLDRISRDQEDLANLYKRVRFAGARIVTLSEGEIGSIHIGMGGTMSALFLEQLGEKVRRGQIGRVEAGRIPGGISYGYRAVRQLDERGEPVRGLREIDEEQAAVIRRIFQEYAGGRSGWEIARRLNAEGIPSPRGGLWRANAITGHRQRGNGILFNQLYRGRIVYNRQSFRKDPLTRKRVSRPNDIAEHRTVEVPELRIIDEHLWNAVSSKLQHYGAIRPEQARRPRRLLSGLMKCGCCGGNYVIVGSDRWGCSTARQTGTCLNQVTITNAVAEKRIFAAVRRELLHPDVVAAYLDELRIAAAEERRRWVAERADRDRSLARIEQEQARIADAIIGGLPPETFRDRAQKLAAERETLLSELDEFPDLETAIAHPGAIEHYRRQVAALHELVAGDTELIADARKLLESLITMIEVSARADGRRGADLILHGDLAALLQLDTKKPAEANAQAGNCMPTVVAGVGFEPTTFRL